MGNNEFHIYRAMYTVVALIAVWAAGLHIELNWTGL